jgi:hypothetical protein
LVPLLLGDDGVVCGAVVVVELSLDELGAEDDGGMVDEGGSVLEGGDADGVRSPGRSPTRSVRDSLQAVRRPAERARAQRPVSTLFISRSSSPLGLRDPSPEEVQRRCRRRPA